MVAKSSVLAGLKNSGGTKLVQPKLKIAGSLDFQEAGV